MATSYQLKVVTPERTVCDKAVTMISVRSTEGEIGILAHHVHIITPLVPYVMTIYGADGKTEHLNLGGGFLEVGDTTIILADSAEWASEIDVARAERARQRAVETLATGGPNLDLKRAQRALARAENRLKLAGSVPVAGSTK